MTWAVTDRYRAVMRSERVTVNLPAELMDEVRAAVRHGSAASISAYIVEAVAARQLRERSLARLADLYGGPPPDDELAEARRALRLVPPAARV
jgi:Arc/MetJ-type ribon-helix-helix transcriptional regulator